MKNNIEDIDKLIKETLTKEEAKFYDELDEQGVLGMMSGMFTGKNAWLLVIMNMITLIAFVFAIYCTIQFFNAEVTSELIKWAVGGIIGLMMVSMLKIFMWMQMDKKAIIREIKRLELQVSSLSGKMSD